MRRWLLPFGTVLLLLPAATLAHATPRELRLDNGLRVLLDPDRSAVGVDVAVWYGTGPAEEPAGRTGITHLMERLMFRGSPRFAAGEYAKRVGAQGGTFNTFLAPDFCEFYSTAPGPSLGTLLELEADRMAGQRLTAVNVAAETKALAEEQQRTAANPVTHGLQQLYATAFGAHAYASPLQGTPEDRARLTAAACAEYSKARLGPGAAMLTVVGDFDPDSAEAQVRRTFGAIAKRGTPAPARPGALPADGERRGRVRSPIRILFAGWRAPADSACGAELAVIAHLLGAGTTPQLSGSLVDEQHLALTASCGFDGRRRASFLFASAWPAAGADTAALEQALVERVEHFARDGVTEAELTAARKALLLAAKIDRQGVRGRAQALGLAAMTDGDWRAADRRLERLAVITPADVQRVAKDVLVPARRTIVWAVPEPPAAPVAKKGGRS